MPIQHSPTARQTRSQDRAQANRGPIVEGEAPSRKEGRGPRRSTSFSGLVGRFPGTSRTIFRGYGEDGEEEGGILWKRKGLMVLKVLLLLWGHPKIMANLKAASSSEASRPPAFKPPSMKAPECFYGTQPFKGRSFIQSCQLIFNNDLERLSQDRKKVLYATSFLIGRA
ncbi:hypothetical protein O181_066950 [Austropuccinia psidii MF-1]|uniref:Uncharacterized protein n=1 Tax=Austropuccinia psidii MF-1 TaxID=1389203 RepID=A0A9Q3EPW7_9BASI|nr:hypothetical protein [Austropuccinia psidii MF-1]